MTVSPQSQAALAADARRRTREVDERIEAAIKRMRRRGVVLSISALAREADVARSVIHRRPGLRERIKTLAPLTEVPDEPAVAVDTSENSIIAALRTRVKAKEAQINDLKNQLRERDTIIAILHGELAKRPPTQ